jgi:signal transduction histidine kinase
MRTGLYTSYAIVEKHHGEIDVKSEPGKGTAITVSFPADLETTIIR